MDIDKIGNCDLCSKEITKKDEIETRLSGKLYHKDCYYDDLEDSYTKESYYAQ